jgi:lysophospholipase L1-like esterase
VKAPFVLGLAGALAVGLALATWSRSRVNHWPIRNAAPSGRSVVAFGDSLTEGYRMEPGESYPEQLSRRLALRIVNAGVSGDTTASALDRLEKDVLAHEPRVVLLCLGGNDMLRRLPAERQFANLRQAIERIQRTGALVILLGLDDMPTLLGGGVDYGQRYRRLAEEAGALYVPDLLDGVRGDRALMYDAIHPNARGYGRIAERLADEVGDSIRR